MDGDKDRYVGMRDLSNPDEIEEKDIVGQDGSIIGVKNRVKAGTANFENIEALKRKRTEEKMIVIYTTSFRGVRTTFEDCKYLISLFYNLRVKIEERDVYINQQYFRELEERLEGKVTVPQVFISGQHIGGKERVEELNELGELRKLLSDFPKTDSAKKCDNCGGYEFIPCLKCGGSKNSVANNFTSEFRALRCTSCNENGLQPCPQCNS